MNVKAEMLAIRRERYDSEKDLPGTVNGYMAILERAKKDPAVPYGDISICLGSIALVLHEANQLPAAIAAYTALLRREMADEMRARILQNLGAALMANHKYDDAVKSTEEALRYAKAACVPELIEHLEFNLESARKNAANPPEKIIVLGLKTKVSNKDLEEKLRKLEL